MLDTLKIAKRLEAANLSTAQAEAIAEAIAQVTDAELAAKADLKETELRLSEKIIQSERATRNLIIIAYGGILGTYGLIVASVFVNHFWR
jgi:hypothetical protein